MPALSGVRIFAQTYAAAKQYVRGTHRVRAPRETVAQYGKLMARLGITRLANITGLDTVGIPVYVAVRPNARCLATSQGKGLDHDSAKASALMESIETWHAETMLNPLRWESYQALAREARAGGDDVVDPIELAHYRPPPPETPSAWVSGFDIMNDRPCWVPLDAVTLNFVAPPERGTDLFRSTNGLSSGNHMLEAVVHGFCEVIERDAEALWRLDTELRQLDLTSVTDPYCREVLERLQAAGVFTAAWDLTSDVGIPVYGCAIMERPDPARLRSMGIHYGFGCHLAPEVALSRALTEAVQTRLTYISGSRDDFQRHDYQRNRDPELLSAIWDEITGTPSNVRVEAQPSRATATFEGDVARLLEAVGAVGVRQVLVVDLTRPEIALPVVRVVVPRLEGPGGHRPGARARRAIARDQSRVAPPAAAEGATSP
jgi:ribosomal protein S12 methylthiotransferase accessory factor